MGEKLSFSPFFMYEILFDWPDRLINYEYKDSLYIAARHLRLQQFLEAESILLARLSLDFDNQDIHFLLSYLYLRLSRYESFLYSLSELKRLDKPDGAYYCFMYSQYLLQIGDISKLGENLSWLILRSSQFWPLQLIEISYYLKINDLSNAYKLVCSLSQHPATVLESVRLKSSILVLNGQFNDALALLSNASLRFPSHLPLRIQLLDCAVLGRSQLHTLPILNQLLQDFSLTKESLASVSQVRLIQNRSAESRQLILKNRVWNTITPNTEYYSTNLYNCYDRLGLGDWLLHSPFFTDPSSFTQILAVKENLCMSAASLEHYDYSSSVSSVMQEYSNRIEASPINKSPDFVKVKSVCRIQEPLTILWLSSDFSYHPVGRFLYGYFSALSSPIHKHIIVDLNDHGVESTRYLFEPLTSVESICIPRLDLPDRVSDIRNLNADIAVDLSGWTSGHFMPGFLSNLSPIQVTYLGYFASTFNPSIDYWLGDSQLFPDTMQESHTESIWRLGRCFLAWQPPSALVESSLDVPSSPFTSSTGIRFGSFNHHRKLSNETLQLWGKIINSVPGSSLVLKMGESDDPGTFTLLSKRMRRAGLDPERITWIPRPRDTVQHLNQYSLVDVALDCFPNGGCTTTCEALWMGVPVITSTGNSYVSRMSSAVLHGANLPNWCLSSKSQYFDFAVLQAENLSWLRANRHYWRQKLINSPLGNASDLMTHIELAFSKMVKASR
ncbi:O-linked N-acetylglucosamine transferase SPINDLY family-like [Synechococcus sp. CC9902]|uniref:O-linked N-acetylglucosamine transferase family protein n=1 Tax=Synechococcus sp. (strain CC9902) TaxID=316279 RepID=UPI00005D3D0A|nr:O-linked N-acetylglucosamine transferase [Synechococcus sp. CC9902]ABB25088.1 O-linked N-acetylglucosamine transferase SPINDLY family-like [Synechococcus sp. CC9902]